MNDKPKVAQSIGLALVVVFLFHIFYGIAAIILSAIASLRVFAILLSWFIGWRLDAFLAAYIACILTNLIVSVSFKHEPTRELSVIIGGCVSIFAYAIAIGFYLVGYLDGSVLPYIAMLLANLLLIAVIRNE